MTQDAPVGIELRPATADEMLPLLQTTERAFGADQRPDSAALEIAALEPERTLAAFDGNAIVGSAAIYTFEMTVPGGPAPVAGVTWVGVLPTHRRRGILSALMRRQLTELREQQREPVAALWASEPGIYRRFGYGLASTRLALRVESRLPFVAGAPATQRLRMVEIAAVRETLQGIYDRARATRPGMVSRSAARWELLLADAERDRDGASSLTCVLLEGDNGFLIYRTKQGDWQGGIPNGKAMVRDFIATDAAGHATLWRYLLDLDLMAKIDAFNRPVDDPIQHLVADPRRLHQSARDALWVRVVDVDRALAARTYAAADSIVIEVLDPVCPWNAGRFSLEVDGADSRGVSARRTNSSADITMSAVELGAIYLGGTRLRDLASAGFVDEHTAGALARADRLFAGAVEPWCPEVF